MTVINVTKWNHRSPEEYTSLDDVLLDVKVSYGRNGTISWSWNSVWDPAYPGYKKNQLTARIWSFECHLDGGKKMRGNRLGLDWRTYNLKAA